MLLRWIGSGSGIWGGYLLYEQLAEELRLLEETQAILRGLEIATLTLR